MASYWGRVVRQAWTEALAEMRLDSFVRILTAIVIPLASAGIVWSATGKPALAGAVGVALLLLLALAVFTWKLFIVPAKMALAEAVERQSLSARLDQRALRQATREALGGLLLEGQAIMATCRLELPQAPIAEAEDWAARAETALATLGRDYIARFRNAAGLPLRATAIQNQPHRHIDSNVDFRCARLQEFIRELL